MEENSLEAFIVGQLGPAVLDIFYGTQFGIVNARSHSTMQEIASRLRELSIDGRLTDAGRECLVSQIKSGPAIRRSYDSLMSELGPAILAHYSEKV